MKRGGEAVPLVLGVDIGSVGAKATLFDGQILGTDLIPTGWSPGESGRQLTQRLLTSCGVETGQLTGIVATGYGRKTFLDATRKVTEITCHARGARFLSPDVRTVIDIGGQDSKVIAMDASGVVSDFAMNDRCAAGTGRFIQMAAAALGFQMDEFLNIPLQGEELPISSMCAVFAETELVNHLAQGANRESLARGIFRSISTRVAGMLGRLGWQPPIFFSGGLARSEALRVMLSQVLQCDVAVDSRSQFAGAIGAALIGWEGKA